MRVGLRFAPGWIAIGVASGLLAVALVALVRPVQIPHYGPASVPPEGDGERFLRAVRHEPAHRSAPPDPFRVDHVLAASEIDAAGRDMPRSYVPPPPRVVGRGRRADGIAFIGCEVPGRGIVIVREGGACGPFRLIEVAEDSVRFSFESSDSILAVALGPPR